MQQNQCKLDSKTLTLLQDQMEHEAVACKKLETYAAQFSDQTLAGHANTLACHHREHFNKLLGYLNSCN